ncbi:MAG: phospho-sugar mutase [Caldicoprobacter oshimai]|uniref:Phosphoglucomutase n=1 Tax=Caldicoprobacter faecalis TaxID=937334 RepID=A0A1I5TUZ7_9FIRM|nr:phospho-sugar mutase [Caldicoprobacter faecalis]PZN12032.1 MAG: phospho-sugar mutase [Caldicoprobacter oshimai]SFP86731.1 alpha-phosphoglucomutase [Caldicoprobacter faecalis]
MDYRERYRLWMESPVIDKATKEELAAIAHDEKELEDRFYKDLEFGTGGLRGIIGAGSNRMNKYTVGRATQGLANYIKKQGPQAMNRGVVIAYDSRRMSKEFALETALVLNANGIKTYLYDELQPTPVLSFSVRELGAIAGVVITASHNPPAYNGYKVYWEDGGQVPPSRSEEIIKEVYAVERFEDIKTITREEAEARGLFHIIGENVLSRYIERVKQLCINKELVKEVGKELKIVYTPLHGTGNKPVRRVLGELGFKNVIVVPEQELPDPEFRTVKYPNPEEPEAFALAIELAKKHDADIIIGTDPDSDRLGVVVKDKEGKYVVLTGNQLGALLVNYVLGSLQRAGKLPSNGAVIKTIVTSEMGREIAKSYGIETVDTYTGFKFIGEKIKEFEETGDKVFLFGYEESYGYLAGDFVRDKDGIIASMLACEMAAYYKSRGMTLYDGLVELWKRFGYYHETQKSVYLEGKEGMERIKAIMEDFRANPPLDVGGVRVTVIKDYKDLKAYHVDEGKVLPIAMSQPSDVLRYTLADGSWFAVRPSGTEPKIKFYFSTVGKSLKDAEDKMDRLVDGVMARAK